MIPKIAVVNHQTQFPAETVLDWAQAVYIQVNRDLAGSDWGIRATMGIAGPTTVVPPEWWQVVLLDDTTQAGALGYHDITASGQPLAKVFVKTAMSFGEAPSVTLSHEVLEMLVDPFVALVVMDGSEPTKFWAYEVCDAVESDAHGYDITLPSGKVVRVSDFVLPQYFNSQTAGTALPGPYSFKQSLNGTVPTLTPGGYMAFVQNGVWSQIQRFSTPADTPARTLEELKQRVDSFLEPRRLLRLIPRKFWVRSAT